MFIFLLFWSGYEGKMDEKVIFISATKIFICKTNLKILLSFKKIKKFLKKSIANKNPINGSK